MLKFCSNSHGLGYDMSKYGTSLTGAPLHPSPYDHKFGYDRNIQLCKQTLSQGEVAQFRQFIQMDYHYKLFIDGLPSASILRDKQNKELPGDYFHGIPIGKYVPSAKVDDEKFIMYNHLDIVVVVHDTMEGHHRIVGFEVEPYSIAEGLHRIANNPGSEPNNQYAESLGGDMTFSYRIITRVSSRSF